MKPITTARRTRNAEAQKRRRERQHDAGKTQFRAWVTVSEALKLKAALAEWRTATSDETIHLRRQRKLEELRRRARHSDDASSAADRAVNTTNARDRSAN